MAATIFQTYCNPLALPDYPRGMASYDRNGWGDEFWCAPGKNDFRETADPSVLYHDGKWYLYSSCGSAYVSEDFVTWRHHRIEPYNPGYAPTIAAAGGKFYLTACGCPIYVADDPLGPFRSLGPMRTPDGNELKRWPDPMLFCDDDGAMYAYWGLSSPGIFGAELDRDNPCRMISEPKILFSYNPDNLWERFGDFNENPNVNYNEGPWMFKHGRRYYLIYATPGTQWKTYCMAAYISDGPVGPFVCQQRNPILRDVDGMVNGPGHGCIVRGPSDTIWAFYTCLVRNEHIFERRIGMDPAGIDADGNLFVRGASEIPQFAPGVIARPELGNDFGLAPVSVNYPASASSEKSGHFARYAFDNSMGTWWMPEDGDDSPWVGVSFAGTRFRISAARVLWKDHGLSYDGGVLPGPFKFQLQARTADGEWTVVADRSQNSTDMLIDYLTFTEVEACGVRLVISGWPKGIRPALLELTVFGRN